MRPYRNCSGSSNIISYQIFEDAIHVVFKSGRYRNYLYTYRRPGRYAVEHMKNLAIQGISLNSYITSVVKNNYERKW
ncbi:hypothetical protein FUT84_06540 [Treponema phagedenis]|uniref:Uncharacterized protein n=1 Tax=Treponema phagedenis TaxID=162 RepID=A0AAE6M7X2_TREPH|nr:hypothetical protein FUT79_06875 [Treponema phagedenis]QEJ98310.1 hypothetical protein FUT82_10090 [Treponema phagedenis]QEK00864.1 hypothetical protein FUT84_06540 [Treponema phagedenis]QEK03820.1 hypothetical protein FUT83_08400 [Treponema phagedenis]QEK05871.1 hypothetical protein FUT80_03455 [Treponema phagedenis]